MAKFAGMIGFIETKDMGHGIFQPVVTERMYYGDVYRWVRHWDRSDSVNDDLSVNNEISVLADPYLTENLQDMRYVNWMGTLWKITNLTVEFPRVKLTLGGVYNGEQA